ncbi:hypothetical protein [Listeria booriae]|uniref:Uncharacterized protein n=1 Tax=Listeria booriae TaxID=1552123 RepID=A0A842FBV7_9LIST|nr:hypothetical protein [Listeria booriae]MBC2242252.1 hypothetical protein [Listeria booriae]
MTKYALKIKPESSKNFRLLVVMIGTLLLGVLYIALTSSALLAFPFQISDNVLALKEIGDYILVGMWFLSAIFANVTIYRNLRKKGPAERKPIRLILAFFNNAILTATLTPLVTLNERATSEGVQHVVRNTYIFYAVAVAFLIVSLSLTLFYIQGKIQESNWWVFVVSVPYIIISWVLQRGYTSLHEWTQANDFSYNSVAAMLQAAQKPVFLLNDMWFQFLAFTILNAIFLLGVILLETFWQKTANWRQGPAREEA